MNLKKLYLSIVGALIGFLVTAKSALADLTVDDLGLQNLSQQHFVRWMYPWERVSKIADVFIIWPIIIIFWVATIIIFFKRRRALKKSSPIISHIPLKKQIIHLFVWLLFFLVLYIENRFASYYIFRDFYGDVENANVAVYSAVLIIKNLCIGFGLFLVLPKLVIKEIAYLTSVTRKSTPDISDKFSSKV